MPHSSHDPSSSGSSHETRRLILQVAHRPFIEQGYRGVSTRQIADACGITQPALYRHFTTKQDLYIEVLLEMLQQLQARLARLVERHESVMHRLHLVARVLPATWEDTQQMFHDIEHELDEPGRHRVSEAFNQRVVAPIASLFAEGMAQGLLRDREHGGLDAIEATYILFRLLDDHGSAGTQSRLQHADRMVDVLFHGLKLHSASET